LELAVIGLALLLLALGRMRAAALAAVLLGVVIAGGSFARAHRTELVATFLDVGQGDAIVLELPRGHAILVDGGGSFDPSFDPGRTVIEPFLRRQRISHLDLL